MSELSGLEKVAKMYLKDKRRSRIYRFVFIVFIACMAYFTLSSDKKSVKPSRVDHIGLIDIKGPIFDGSQNSAQNLIKSIEQAYKFKHMMALVLRINSPGGSPVQASYIYKELRRLKKQYPEVKTYTVCTDICASAAYYIAAATDEIIADESSMVGSIGVVFNGFGFVETLQKLGVQRRLITAGKNKGFLDPFSPESPEQVTHLKRMLADVHQQFIESVKHGRGERLKSNPDLFSGLIWSGEQAKKLGLVDDIGSVWSLSREKIKLDKVVNYTHRLSFAERISKRFAGTMANMFLSQLKQASIGLA